MSFPRLGGRVLAVVTLSCFLGLPAIAQTLTSLTLNQSSVVGGFGATGTVTLSAVAPSGGTAVSLTSSQTAVATVPTSVTVASGATLATFTVSAAAGASGSSTISAMLSAVTKTQSLTVSPATTAYALALSPSSVVKSSTSTATVTLNGVAPAAGALVTLTSSNTAVATVPANVTVTAGATSATFTVTSTATTGTSTIQAVYGGVTVSAVQTVVNAVQAYSVTLNQASVKRGGTVQGTVTLNGPAPAGNSSVTMTSGTPASVTVPSPLTIAAGSRTATFTATSLSGGTATSVTISASVSGGTTPTATLAITASPVPIALTFTTQPVLGGGTSSTTVTLNGAAASGTTVTLSSSNSAVATVLASIAVTTGATSATFTTTSLAVSVPTDVIISASFGGVSVTGTLTVTPGLPTAVAVSPTSVISGAISNGTVTLSGPAPAGNTTLALASSNTSVATVPATVVVNAGATTSAQFQVATLGVASSTPVTITATRLGTSASTTLTVTPAALTSVSVAPTTVSTGTNAVGTVTLTGKAGPAGTVVTLSAAPSTAASVPPSVTVLANTTSITFPITSLAVDGSTAVTITATFSVAKTATLTVTPASISAVSVSPTSVVGGNNSTGTVTLGGVAGSLGAQVSLTSSNTSIATVPISVTVNPGQTTGTFQVSTLGVSTSPSATITATLAAVQKTASLTVTPAALSAVALSPTTLAAPGTSAGTVTLTGFAPLNGTVISLSSSNTQAATAPTSVTVPQNADTATFTATALAVGAQTTPVITASLSGVNRTANLTVNPPTYALASVTVNPTAVMGGISSTGTVTLGAAAPVGGVLVALSSDNSYATVSATVTVLSGTTAAGFNVATTAPPSSVAATITATANGATKTASLTVNPCVAPIAPAPTNFQPGDVVWVEDDVPSGAETDNWNWDTTQKASGTQSNTSSAAAGYHERHFWDPNSMFYVAATDTVVVYVLVDPCDPPQEIMLEWHAGDTGWEHRAFWGADLIDKGTPGTPARVSMGAIPTSGQWVRLSIPASTLDLGGRTLYGMLIDLYGGHAWFDRLGKTVTCTPPIAPPPTIPPGETVWIDDSLPVGAEQAGVWNWDTTQKASGTKSHHDPAGSGLRERYFVDWSNTFFVAAADSLVTYVLVDPCDPPQEIMLQWYNGENWEHRAFWGADLIDKGATGTPSRVSMGALPTAGQWIRLSIPASVVDLEGRTLNAMAFDLYGGNAWFDRSGKVDPNVATALKALTVTPITVAGGISAIGTVTLTDPAPSGGVAVSLSSSDAVTASVPSSVAVPQGASSATFPVTTIGVFNDVAATLTATFNSNIATASLSVAASTLSSLSIAPAAVTGASVATGIVTLSSAAPEGGATIGLSSDNGVATMPGSVLVPAGTTSSTFSIRTANVASTIVTISATLSWQTKTATLTINSCVAPTAPAPAIPSGEIAWVDDDVPPDASLTNTWIWDTNQKASGTQSHTEPASGGPHQHFFNVPPSSYLWVSPSDTLVTYVLLDPCEPPTELMLQFSVAGEGWDHRAYWGDNLMDWGTDGTESLRYMGPLPPAGRWVRLEVPASVVGAGGRYLDGLAFTLYDGHAWFDRSGKAGVCMFGTAPPPAVLPNDTVWFDDAIPPGSSAEGTWTWDADQKMSGAASHTEDASKEPYEHLFYANGDPFPLETGDSIVQYVLLDPCDTPREIMLQFGLDGWEHRAYWGDNIVVSGNDGTESRRYMGALPAAGGWARLEIPISVVGISGGQNLVAMSFTPSNGRAWFDRTGKNATPLPSVSSLTLVPASAAGGSTVTSTVTLSSAAPSTGATVTLLSSDSEIATVPTFVTIPAGQSSATFVVSTLPVEADSSAPITAVYLGQSQSVSLAVTAGSTAILSALSVDPTQVAGGSNATGTVTLTSTAPAGGALVSLTSSDSLVAAVPSSVLVPAGQSSATFAISTYGVVSDSAAQISASYLGDVKAAWLSVSTSSTVSLVSVTLTPTSILGGSPVSGTATLSRPAPAAGIVVGLSSNSGLASVPANVTVAEGASTAAFTVSTVSTESRAVATITGTYSSVARSAGLTITAPAAPSLVSLVLDPSFVMGSLSSTGTVTLSLPARTGGADVSLLSDNSTASVPPSVTVVSGSTTATFTLSTTGVLNATTVTISASFAGNTQTAILTVGTCASPQAVAPSSFPSTDVVWVDDAVPQGAYVSDNWIWDTTQKASGTQSHQDPAITGYQAHSTFDGSSSFYVAATDTVVTYVLIDPCNPPQEIMLEWHAGDTGWEHRAFWGADLIDLGTPGTPSRVSMGAIPAAGQWVRLPVPASTLDLGGRTLYGLSFDVYDGHAWFDRSGKGIPGTLNGTVVNASGGAPISDATLSVNGAGVSATTNASGIFSASVDAGSYTLTISKPAFNSLTTSAVTVTSGQTTNAGTLSLVPLATSGAITGTVVNASGGAPIPGVTVAGTGTGTTATTDASGAFALTIAEGTCTLSLTKVGFSALTTSPFTVTAGQTTVTGALELTASALASLSLSPVSVTGGSTSTGTVTLTGTAPAGGMIISLSSDRTSAAVPANVTISASSTSVTFTVTTTTVGTSVDATISASAEGATRSATLSVNPPVPVLSAIWMNPSALIGGPPSTGTVTLTAAAWAGGFVVNLSSNNAAATVQPSITLAQGLTSATFPVTTTTVATSQTATIAASAGAVTLTASLRVSPPLPAGELTEGNASDWTSFASDSAATNLTNDSSHVRFGASSLKLVTASGADTGIRYPASGDLHWDLSAANFLTFWAYVESAGSFSGNQPTLLLKSPGGTVLYAPASPLTFPNQWHAYQIAMAGDSGWSRTVTGTFDLSDVIQLEIHHQSPGSSFAVYYDGFAFVDALPGELTEGNASDWATFASDYRATTVSNDATHVKVGSTSIKFDTQSGFDTGVIYPAAGAAHWDLTTFDSLSFWLYAVNPDLYFQNNQPVLVLKSPNGSFRYEPSGTLMTIDAWRLYQIPLAGGGPWTRTSTGSPTLADVNQLELHSDTWGYGFTLYIDGLTFGRAFPGLVLSISPVIILSGDTATGTVSLNNAAPAGGSTVSLSSSNAGAATAPTAATIAAGETTATFTVSTTTVAARTDVTLTAAIGGETKTATLTVLPPGAPLPGTVSGTVVNASGGGSLQGATVSVNGTASSTVTNSSGAFSVSTAAETYTLTVTKAGFNQLTTSAFAVAPGQTTNVGTLALVPLPAPGTFNGTVVNASGGGAISGATVTVTGTGAAGTTDGSGLFSVSTAAGTYTLLVTKTGFTALTTSTFAVASGQTTNVGTLSLVPVPAAALASLSLSPASVGGGSASTCTVTLTDVAPIDGAVISLSSDNASAWVTDLVTINAGAISATFPVTASAVGVVTGATISGTYSGITKTATLTIFPCPLPTTAAPDSFPPDVVWFDDAPPPGANLTGTWIWDSSQKASGIQSSTAGITSGTTQHSLQTSGNSSLHLSSGDRLVVYALIDPCFPPREVMLQWYSGGSWEHRAFWGEDILGFGSAGTESRFYVGTISIGGEWTRFEVPAASVGLDGQTVDGIAFTLDGGRVWFDHVGKVNENHVPAITGTVVNVSGGAAIAGATVSVTGTGTKTTTDASGAFALAIDEGMYSLTVSKAGFSSLTTDVFWATADQTTAIGSLTLAASALASLSFSPVSVIGGTTSTGTVTLTAGAPAGGAVISVSSNSASAVVPASVTVSADATSATFTVTTTATGASTNATISGSYMNVTKSGALAVNPPILASLSLSPASLAGGTSSYGTVTLTTQAPAGAAVVALSSDNAAAGVPPVVTIEAGSLSANFSLTTSPVGAATTATITATYAAATRTAVLIVNPPVLTTVSLVPTSVASGAPSTGTVVLATAAPAGGAALALSSDNGAASVPASVTVAAGATSATFIATTAPVAGNTIATIAAAYAGVTQSAALTITASLGTVVGTVLDASTGVAISGAVVTITGTATTATTNASGSFSVPVAAGSCSLTVTAPNLQPATTASLLVTAGQTTDAGAISLGAAQGFTFNVRPAIASGSGAATAIVSLVAAAPTGGETFNLTSDSASFVVPATVMVAAGRRVLTFPVTYTRVASSTWVTISATNAGVTNQAHVTLTPGPTVVSVLQPAKWPYIGRVDSIFGPADLESTVALSEPAPAGGLQVSLASSSAPMVSVPATILVPAGALLVTFPVHAAAVATTTTSTITASLPNGSVSALLTDTSAVGLSSISVPPYGRTGKSIQIRVVLNEESPTGTFVVNLTSSNPTAVPVPATVQPTGYPPVQAVASVTLGAASASPVVITASLGGISRSTTIMVSSTSTAVGASFDGGTLSLGITDPPPSYAYVYFYSSNPSVVSLPDSATISSGNTSASVNATVTRSPYTASVVLSGTCDGREVMTPPSDIAPAAAPSGLSVSAYMGSGTGTVYLNAPAPTGGVTVLLGASAPSALSLPGSVLVPTGTNSASFSFSTLPVTSATFVSVTATSSGVTLAQSLTIQPPVVWDLSLSPTYVPGGGTSIGTVTLNEPAPTGGYPLSLSSSNELASVPAAVTVPEGATSVPFTITTVGTSMGGFAAITVANGQSTRTANLEITSASIASISLSPSVVLGGTTATGTVTLYGLGPAGGARISLESGNLSAATLPADVTVPAGAPSATFTITTFAVGAPTNVNIKATWGSSRSALLTVTPLPPFLSDVSVVAPLVSGGLSLTGHVSLSTVAPAGGLVVALTSSNPSLAAVPASVTVPATSLTGTFSVTTAAVASPVVVSIWGSYGGIARDASFTIEPARLGSVSLSPFSLAGGTPSTGTVSLIGNAHAAGVAIALSSSNSNVATVPAGITVPSGANTATFQVATNSALNTGSATISATGGYQAATKTALLTITPAPVSLASFSVTASTVVAGGFVDATVTLNAPAADGTRIDVSSTNPSIISGDSVFIATGASSGTIRVYTNAVSSSSLVTLSASYNGVAMSAPITVTPAAITLMTFAPSPAGGGYGVSGTLTLNGLAPAGTVVTFSSSNPSVASVPASVTTTTVTGASSYSGRVTPISFTITTVTVSAPTPVTITATLGASSITGVLSVEPVGLASVTDDAVVTLNAPAPAGGFSVAMTISGAARFHYQDQNGWDLFTTSGTRTIPAGQTQSSDVGFKGGEVFPEWAGISGRTDTVTATLNGVTRSATGPIYPGTATFTIDPAEVGLGGTTSGRITFDWFPNYTSDFPVDLSSSAEGIVLTGTHLNAHPGGPSEPIYIGTPWTFPISVAANSGTGATTISATFLGYTASAPLTVGAAATLSGVAPGWVLPGDTTPVLYGSGITPGSTVTFTGPVYSLTNQQDPLCSVDGACPSSTLATTVDVGGAYAAFAVPSSSSPGIYQLKVRSASGFETGNYMWIGVDSAQKTYPAVARDQHNWAKRIWPGQTVTGTLTGDVPLNDLSDYNYYFFVATAGSRVSVAMHRVDTSVPFGNSASLDPQVEIIAPDHFIYENLQGFDDVPSVDYNASITNAVLPYTGVYFIAVETTRGSGDYRLTFNVDSMAPPPQTSRAVAFSGNHSTLTVNTTFTTYALMLDPRGWPLSGAGVNHAVIPSPDNLGTLQFVGGSTTTTSVDGYAFVSAKLTSPGKVGFSPVLVDPTLAQGVVLQEGETAAALHVGVVSQQQAAQRYRPAGRLPIRIVGVSGNELSLSGGRLERFPAPEPAGRKSITGEELRSSRRATLRTKAQSASTSKGTAGPAPQAARSPARPLTIRPQVITGCFPTVFDEAAVSAPQVNPPFTVVLTDETPSTGQSTPNGEVDEIDGIHGHRTEKEIRLRIEIKDAYGQTPSYPVLVSLALGGSAPGTLILDPAGARIECESASLFWHETPGANEEIGYKLGTYSHFLGVEVTTPPYKPVWGMGELLDLAISTLDASGLSQQNEYLYPVRVEPGKPDHFSCVDTSGVPCPDLLAYWSDFLKFRSGTKLNGDPRYESLGTTLFNSYFLHDRYDNVTYGYTSTSASHPQPNILVEFKDQTLSIFGESSDTTDFAGYSTWVHWNDDPSMPAGRYTTTLSVTYPNDPDWAGGTVTKDLGLQFDRGTYHALVPVPGYEARLGVDDGGTPFSVAPGATTASMPKTSAGDVQRLVLLGMTGSQVIGSWPLRVEPFEDPHTIWKQNPSGSGWVVDRLESPQDPRLETSDAPRFRLSLRDEEGKVVTEGAFRVHRCPRFDHEGPPQQSGPTGQAGRPCDTVAVPPLDSIDGVVDPVILNPSGGSNNRGYLGIELLRAPAKLGYYFLQAEPSAGDTPRYRRRLVNNEGDDPAAEYVGGDTFFVVENKIDPNAMCCTCQDGKTLESPCTASPVFAATGTYQSEATDLVLPTVGLPVQVSRQYFSSKRQGDLNGIGWSSSLQAHLAYAATSAGQVLDVQMPTGVVFRFTFSNANGPFTPPQGRKDTLVKNVDKTFDLTLERSRIVYHFDDKGRLVSMADEFGNTVTIGYDASGKPTQIADASGSGRSITVSYRGDGKIDRLQDSAGRSVQYAYAADGTLTSVTDPAGRATRYSYTQGSFGPLLTQIADDWNRVLTVMTYDVADRTKTYTENFETYSYTYIDTTHTRKTDSLGNSTTIAFGGSGLIVDRTPPATGGSGTTHKDYDSDGNVTRIIDEVGARTDFTYDPAGRVTSVTRDVLGSPVRFDYTYDPAFPDKVTSVTPRNPISGLFDPNWQGRQYDYLASGTLNHAKRIQSDGSTANTISTFQYDALGRVTQQISSTDAVTDYVYTGANLTTVTQPSNADSGVRPITRYSNYDGAGRPRTITDPAGKDTTYTYDGLGRVLTVNLPPVSGLTFTTAYSYDNFDAATGLAFTNITDPNGKLTKLGYDQHGRLLKSIDALNNVTTYAYTNDVLTSITDANGNVTSYHYDPLKRLDRTTFPDGSIESYAYRGDGLLASKTDRRGQTIAYFYDGFKRLEKKDYGSNGSVTYTYQGQKLTQVDDTFANPAETHTFAYDSSYRVQQNVQGPRGTLSYTYTPDDRVDTMTIAGTPSVTTAHTYYPDGSLNTIAWSPQSDVFKYAYTPRGQYQTVTFPNGQARGYTYDDQGRLTQLSNTLSATNIATYAYGYDTDWATGQNTMLGQRVSMTANVPSQGFTNAQTKYSYDPLYQLKKAEYPNVAPFNAEVDQWTYDAVGNRLTNQVNSALQNYTYFKNGANPLNGQELQSDGTNTYTYDLNGNQTTRNGPGGNYVFSSDFDNRLRTITGAEGVAYTYDYQGRRTSKTIGGVTTNYLYDGLNLVSETTAGATKQYVFGPSIDEPLAANVGGAISYLNSDGLGSVVATNDPSGAMTSMAIFDAWGTQMNPAATRLHPFTYTGREVGEAGLLLYRARQYQPLTGRFTQEDPIGYRGDAQNLFRYAGNDTVNRVDPTGLWSPVAHDSLIGFALGGRVNDWDIMMIQQGSRDFDSTTQGARFANVHSMRRAGQSPEDATAARDRWVKWMLERARCANNSGRLLDALRFFGWAIHPIMDASSPMHTNIDGTPRLWRSIVQDGWGHSPYEHIGNETMEDIPWATYEQQSQQIFSMYQSVFGH